LSANAQSPDEIVRQCARIVDWCADRHEEAARGSDDEETVMTEADCHRLQAEMCRNLAIEIRAIAQHSFAR
jgi:hypothetical protein